MTQKYHSASFKAKKTQQYTKFLDKKQKNYFWSILGFFPQNGIF